MRHDIPRLCAIGCYRSIVVVKLEKHVCRAFLGVVSLSQRFQPSRFDQESPNLMCRLLLSQKLLILSFFFFFSRSVTYTSYISPSLSTEHPVLCKLIRQAVLLHLAAPKMAGNHGQYFSGKNNDLIEYHKNYVKMQEMPLQRN